MMGGDPIFFFGSNQWFRAVLVFTSTYKGIGWSTIIYLAALSNVNIELYEAAAIDGAGRLRQTWMVTLPAISNIIVLQFILSVRGIVGDDFQQIFNMYTPVVYSTGDVISTYNYRLGLESMRYSFSSAVGLFQNVIALALVTMTNWVVKNFSEYGLW
jgi:putative aldouronate transport system permease protein